MCRRVDVVLTGVLEERIASIFRVEERRNPRLNQREQVQQTVFIELLPSNALSKFVTIYAFIHPINNSVRCLFKCLIIYLVTHLSL
jgi:DNA recombination-dependent growth factor C